MDRHREHLARSGELDRRERTRIAAELDTALRDALLARLLESTPADQLSTLVDRIAAREIVPQSAVDSLLNSYHP